MSSKNKKSRDKGKKTDRVRDRGEKSQKTSGMDDTTSASIAKDRKMILPFVANVLEKGPTGLRTEFVQMRRFNDYSKMKAFKEAQEAGKNRYKDVGCLDNNRVKLGSPWPHDYIHANYVSVPSNPKRFICTQAPLEKTCADFWFMCLQERVENIFMLCNYTEKGAKKCFEYLPTEENKETLVFKEKDRKITVKFESSSQLKFREDSPAKVVKTVLKIEGPEFPTLKTTHFHWIDWPDRGVPPADNALIELLERARPSKSPIVVHCSAGIGRTGSVVMIEYLMDQLLNGEKFEETDKILVKIREQRNNSVQTDHQYLFVHQVMMNHFRRLNLLKPEVIEHHKTFTEAYSKMVV